MDKFEAFPTGKKRKEIIAKVRRETADFLSSGKINIKEKWNWRDSPSDGGFSDGQPFFLSFKDVLPNMEESLKNYIETTLEKRKGQAIGIEFGGLGSNFFSRFTSGFFAQSIGITLVDHRESEELMKVKERDEIRHHQVLEGNIVPDKNQNIYPKLKDLLGKQKVDLIIERMAGGLKSIPDEPYTVREILQIWYDLLREEGIMFVQVPVALNNLLEIWAKKIQKEFKNVLEIQYTKGLADAVPQCTSFRLRKLHGAPDKLPLLEPRIVRKIPKN